MSLVACPDCGKEVSPSAAACIHCGRPMGVVKVNAKSASATIVTMSMIVLISGMVAFGFYPQVGFALFIAGLFGCIFGRIFS